MFDSTSKLTNKTILRLGVVAATPNLDILEAVANRHLSVQDQPGLHTEFPVSQGYTVRLPGNQNKTVFIRWSDGSAGKTQLLQRAVLCFLRSTSGSSQPPSTPALGHRTFCLCSLKSPVFNSLVHTQPHRDT